VSAYVGSSKNQKELKEKQTPWRHAASDVLTRSFLGGHLRLTPNTVELQGYLAHKKTPTPLGIYSREYA